MNTIATLAGGCFWCTEAVFQEVKGIDSIVSGYCGGTTDHPTYSQVHNADTGHAESIQMNFDPNIISYEDILKIFYYIHDPTTLNQDGANYGTEYRSAIFYHDEEQKQIAENVTQNFAPTIWDNPIVTEITAYTKFWPAEPEHQNFFLTHPEQAYCRVIINPKLEKFRKKFVSLLK